MVVLQESTPDVADPLMTFEQFYTDELDGQVRRCFVLTGSNEIANDIVHDAMIEVYRRWSTLEQPGAYLMNDLEQQLSDHFRADGEKAAPQFRLDDIISGIPAAQISTAAPRRSWLRPSLAAAAVVAVTVGGLVVATRSPQEEPPGASDQFSPINWSTENVTFAASAFTIDVNGETFTTDGAAVDFDGDPGDDSSQTLEITWPENGVEMRWYVYFTSDGTDWWADEMRTYDGNSDGEWIIFTGEFFRTPLGTPFTGDVDLNATERGLTSRLRIENMALEPFTDNDILPAPALAEDNPPPLQDLEVGLIANRDSRSIDHPP